MKKIIFSAALAAMTLGLAQPQAHADDVNPNMYKLKQFQEQMRAQGVEIGLPMLTETPEDKYQGDDKQKIKDMVRAEWKEHYPQDEILGMRIRMDDWERYTDKRWSDGSESWYTVDYSELQVLVFVKKDDKRATAWPINVTKDHKNNEKLEVDATGAKATDLTAQDIMLHNLKL